MWQTTHISGWTYDDTEDENLIKIEQDVTEDSRYAHRILFKGDGSCYSYIYGKSSHSWISLSNYFTYDISGSKIILYYKNEVDETYTVLSINDDTIVLQITLEDGPQYKTIVTCKKVYQKQEEQQGKILLLLQLYFIDTEYRNHFSKKFHSLSFFLAKG